MLIKKKFTTLCQWSVSFLDDCFFLNSYANTVLFIFYSDSISPLSRDVIYQQWAIFYKKSRTIDTRYAALHDKNHGSFFVIVFFFSFWMNSRGDKFSSIIVTGFYAFKKLTCQSGFGKNDRNFFFRNFFQSSWTFNWAETNWLRANWRCGRLILISISLLNCTHSRFITINKTVFCKFTPVSSILLRLRIFRRLFGSVFESVFELSQFWETISCLKT